MSGTFPTFPSSSSLNFLSFFVLPLIFFELKRLGDCWLGGHGGGGSGLGDGRGGARHGFGFDGICETGRCIYRGATGNSPAKISNPNHSKKSVEAEEEEEEEEEEELFVFRGSILRY